MLVQDLAMQIFSLSKGEVSHLLFMPAYPSVNNNTSKKDRCSKSLTEAAIKLLCYRPKNQ